MKRTKRLFMLSLISLSLFFSHSTQLRAKVRTFTTAQVALHKTAADCWIIIAGKVYDVTNYIDDHPSPPSLLADVCGADATKGWETKGNAKSPHSRKAAVLLKKFYLGDIATEG